MANIAEKSIGEILNYKFFFSSYKGGYRWGKRQVTDLLDDIWTFILKKNKPNDEWYCLQPIVVKKSLKHFEVLDGQQRLTTIYLILKHLEHFIESDKKSFEIEYQAPIPKVLTLKSTLIK